MRLGIDVSQHQLTWNELLGRVRFAEDAGFDGAWVFDHFKPLYGDPAGPCLEGWTLLAALGAATTRIRLGTLVTGVTYRNPALLAAEAVTVDHVSGGRLELAVGAAWFQQEHEELGFEFPSPRQRVERLDEAVRVLKLLMTTDDATLDGRHYRLRGASYNPKPVQRPHPPLWIGASGEKFMLPLVARHADVWHTFGDIESLRRKSRILDEHAETADRDPTSIARATDLSISENWDEVRRRYEGYREVGISYLVVSWPSEGQERLEEFVDLVMPDLTQA
ncbi:MAG: TIGR03560 family F420-dependent LLM class oxidoreductase [Actinomycetota bacterium]